MKHTGLFVQGACLVLLIAAGCGGDGPSSTVTPNNGGTSGAGNTGGPTGGTGGTLIVPPGSGGTDGGKPGGTGGGFPIDPNTGIPFGFKGAEIGAFKLGPRMPAGAGTDAGTNGGPAGSTGCGAVLTAVVRDFRDGNQPGGHPDFQTYGSDVETPGIVKSTLGADEKPVYAQPGPVLNVHGAPQTTSPQAFRQWYISSDSVNQTFVLYLFLEKQTDGKYTFESDHFFPLDGAGFGDQGLTDGANPPVKHNYLFTTEVHTQFRYKGGETFRFIGDDDLWVFINDKLAIDLGGLHPMKEKTVSLDASAATLGIARNQVYSLDLFHAERHTVASNFRIDTNLEFVNCGTIVSDPIE